MPPYDYGMSKGNSTASMPTIGEEKYMVSENIYEICDSLDEFYDLMESSYKKMQMLRETITDDVWMGESKEQFMLLLEAISKFHLLLKDSLAQNKYAIDSLDGILDEYFNSSTIVSLLEV